MNSYHNLEEAWASFIRTVPPLAESNRAGQVAAIVRGRMEGLQTHALMMNMINKYSMLDEEEDDVIREMNDDELDCKWRTIVESTPPVFGNPRADQIREIMLLENAGIDVDILIANMSLNGDEGVDQETRIDIEENNNHNNHLIGNIHDSAE